jgi:hypothetical protein
MKDWHTSIRRRALTWILLIGAMLTLTLWLVSLVWSFGAESGGSYAAVARGALVLAPDLESDLGDTVRYATFFKHRHRLSPIWLVQVINHSPGGFVEIVLPLWPVALMTGVPGAWLWATRPRRRPGDCPACGYDRRGIDGRCPECGQSLPSVD